MSHDAEMFSSEIPIPASKRKTVAYGGSVETMPKRKYTRRKSEVENTPPLEINEASGIFPPADPLEMAETLFEGSQMSGYYMVRAFIDLYHMVKPEDRPKLAMILEGIVK